MTRRPASLLGLLLVVVLGSPAGALAASTAPPPSMAGMRNEARDRTFAINLASEADHVPQYTAYWCIGASIQMMLNMVGVTDDETRASQVRYMRAARGGGTSSSAGAENAGGLRGAGSSGWARALTQLGAGRYEERVIDGYTAAVRAAAVALRRTGRPVGLIVWRGAHAWVMTGFTATADPLLDPSFRMTGVYVHDSWYPRVSSIWGPGQDPNSWISTIALKADFLPRRPGGRHADQAGKYVLVLPVSTAPRAARTLRIR